MDFGPTIRLAKGSFSGIISGPMSDQVITPVDRARPCIPDYELLRPIGRGAYGEVWLGRNVTGSWVALKIVHRSAFDHDRPFEREFEGIKRFEPISRSDPSQVAILHVGLGEGFFYYVMELADDASAECGARSAELDGGGISSTPRSEIRTPNSYSPKTLKHLLNDRGHLPSGECLAIALSLTRALAHLHGNGLVHRDVKPSNVIFVNGQAKLADMGLVTSVDATRSFVGTEGYLPPEGAGTAQADLFSLGKLLYEMSTGCDRKEFPALPPDISTRSDRNALAELNAIVIHACQLDPRERYASADGMRADLELLQRGKSVRQQQVRRRAWDHAKNIALALGGLAVVSAIVYWLAVGRSGPPDFVYSQIPEAQEEYDTGVRLLLRGESSEQAIKHLERAIELDPDFAEAYARLAGAWLFTGTEVPKDVAERGRSAALKAVSLNTNSSFAHATLASVKILFDLDWAGAEQERRLAVKLNSRGLNPNSEEILLESALNLAVMGKTNEALAVLKQVQARPESLSILRLRLTGFVYEWCRQFDKAINTYDKVIEAVPGDKAWELELQARAYLGKGDYTNAIHFGRLAALEGGEGPASVKASFESLQSALNQGGPTSFWGVQLELEKLRSDRDHLMRMAAIFARLKRLDEALDFLGRARKETPTPFAAWIITNPSFDSLRNDPRFQGIIYELWHKK